MNPRLIITLSIIGGLCAGIVGGSAGSYFAPDILSSTLGIDKKEVLEKKSGTGAIILSEESATTDVVKKASPSVVSIVVTKDLSTYYRRSAEQQSPFDDFGFGFPFPFRTYPSPEELAPEPKKQRVGGGTGFIISADGLLLTNRHVVDDTDAEYTVVTNVGTEYSARVLAKDTVHDLAVVKINAKNLIPLELGDSSSLNIGQTVIAIGNSLGEYSNTVTRGVVSGVNRVVRAAGGLGGVEVLQEAIQTDAAINPGNSGGPLLNLAGQVIGINTAVNNAAQSIGFALPINVAKKSVESVKKHGRIIRPWLGVRYVLINEEMQKRNNLPVDHGALIQGNPGRNEAALIKGSPAEKAGLREGDIILEINGEKIDQDHALANAVTKYGPGDVVTLKVVTKSGTKNIPVTLEEYRETK